MSDFPEHEKLSAVKNEAQAIGEFMDWLADDGIVLYQTGPAEYEPGDGDYPLQKPIRQLLHEFFQIDPKKIEAEKVAMLKLLRESKAQAETVTLTGDEL